MIHDQADELRQLVRKRVTAGTPQGPHVPLIAVSGGKGGVGTTTIAANLAIALARQGRRAVFVDADLDHGGHAMLSQHPERGSVIDVLAGRRTVHEVLERGPSGIQMLSGAWASGEMSDCSATSQQRFVGELKNLTPHAEVVVIDVGSSRNHFVRRFWQAANVVLVVTAPESVSIMESYAAIKVLLAGDASVPIHTLVNLASDPRAAEEAHARIAAACRRFLGVRATASGSIPSSETNAAQAGVLIYPARGEAARAIDRVADTLWAQLQLQRPRDARGQSALSA